MAGDSLDPLSRLVRGLDLDEVRRDLFRGRTGQSGERLFGGLMLAQSVVAAGRTVAERDLHSLHCYFLCPGRPGTPIELAVERVRDGRSFCTRRVVGRQGGEETIVLLASFVRPGEGISHQDPMPPAPGPEGLPDWEEIRAAAIGDPSARRTDLAIDVRPCDAESPDPAARSAAYRRFWMRPKGKLPDDPLIHAALLVFASDRMLLRVAARPHGSVWHVRDAASVDHALWLHHRARFDDWMLYVCESPIAEAGRALALGAIYARDGKRVASVAQEGIVRF